MTARREAVRMLRRPIVFGAIAAAFLVLHHVLVRAMAHGHVAHALLAGGGARIGPAVLACALVVVRLVAIVVVPGLLLAALAEIVAYLLVGPKRTP